MAWYVLADWVRGEMGGREILTPEYRNYAQDRKRWERHPSGPAPESPEFPHVADDVRAEFGAVIRGLAQRIGRPSRAEVDLVYGKDESGNIGRASWERYWMEQAFGKRWWPDILPSTESGF